MGYILDKNEFNKVLSKMKENYKVFAPVVKKNMGAFSDSDLILYDEIERFEDIKWDVKSDFSMKEILTPITEMLFYFTEDEYKEPKKSNDRMIVFLRSCDLHAVKRFDEIYLHNGCADTYYKQIRERIKFILMNCSQSHKNCFCVSMGTNKSYEYDLYVGNENDYLAIDAHDDELNTYFEGFLEEKVQPSFIEENDVKVEIPNNIDVTSFGLDMWREYDSRCIACGRCTFTCPTCTCFTMQDVFYRDNPKNGERRRVWASCHVNGYTDMAGGHSFREKFGDRMRFKTMHKIYDYKNRFGYHMCVGCGRCDDICPQYISFSNCINKLNSALKEV